MISIITPVYRPTDDKIRITIKSLVRQSNKNFEWIVVFDGQSEIPVDLDLDNLTNFKIKWAMTGGNYGPSVARNIGFQISDGDIITYVDIGDELSKKRIEHIELMFKSYPNIEILFDSYTIEQNEENYFFDVYKFNTRNYGIYKSTDRLTDYITNSQGIKFIYGLKGILQAQNISIPMGVAHKRRPFVLNGGFQRGIVCGEDGLLWRRMTETMDGSKIMSSDFNAGIYHVSQIGQSRTQRRFDMGGFAFDASNLDGSHGQYLDKDWFENFNSVNLFEERDANH